MSTGGQEGIPGGLISAVVNLVATGPVPLGAYTSAEIFAVGGLLDFLEQEPSQEAIAEAVRSLAARDLITTDPGNDYIDVRGDIGIAVAFQQRSRVVIDARVTGTAPDTPWRFLLMPQPERVTLEIRIDALGIHFYSLRKTEVAMDRLFDVLPRGDRGPHDAELDACLNESPATALITVTGWRDGSERLNTDLVLARQGDTLHSFMRAADDHARFVAQGLSSGDVRTLVARLADPGAPAG